MAKRGRGRPPLKPSQRKAAQVGVRLRPGDRAKVEKAARVRGLTSTDWIRSRIVAAAERELAAST